MGNNKILLILTLLIVVAISCEKPTETKPTKSVRDYTWTIDTLKLPEPFQNLMRSMYVANSKDIYLVGHNSTGDPNGGMWHYDGKEWETVKLREQVGAFGTLYSIHGSSPNNVWAVGGSKDYAVFLQYNGSNWKKHLAETSDGIFGTPISKHEIYSVYTESETNVWACGDGGLVYHYDGSSWDVDTIRIRLGKNENLAINNVVVFNSEIYFLGVKYLSGNLYGTHYLIKKTENGFAITDSLVEDVYGNTDWKWGVDHFYLSNSNQLYSFGFGGVFEFNGDSWTNIFEYESPITGVNAKNKNDIFVVGDFSLVAHYNGKDWKRLSKLDFNDVVYTCVWQNSNEAFIVGQLLSGYPQQTIVLHGK